MAAPVAVVTDTTTYLPPDLLAELDVATVSLYVHRAGAAERESDIVDLPDYWRRLADTTTLPTTSQPSAGDFIAVYEPLLAAGRDIVSVHLAGGVSGTVDSAQMAAAEMRERHPERTIEVHDSRSVSGGMGLVVLAAGHAARSGAPVAAVAARTGETIAATRIMFAVETLEYLRRGGRIGGAQAWLGSALKIKPILSVRDTIEPVERVRTSARAFERMVRFAHELHDAGADAWAVQHIQAPADAARLAAEAREIFGCEPRFISEIGPVIGTHAGPGLLGLAAVDARLLDEPAT